MIRDLLQALPDPNSIADICIVGAGAAGIVLAVELARQNQNVLLLEAGGHDVEDASQEPYRSEVVGLPHTGIHTGRFRAKGGTTTRWGGQILELDEADFDARPGVEASGWPFPKSHLAPFYERALALEGLSGVMRNDADVWSSLRLSPPAFDSLEPYFSRWCPQPDFGRLHHHTLADDPRVQLWLHANVIKPVLEGDTIRALRCRTLTGIETTFRAHRFVFALGAIECSRFFLQPREAAAPWNRSGLLGKHFQDHIDATVATVEPVSHKAFHNIFDNVFLHGLKYHPKLRLEPAVQRERNTLNAAATMIFDTGGDSPLDHIKVTAKKIIRRDFSRISASELTHAAVHLPLVARQVLRHSLSHRIYNPPSCPILLRVHCEQEPSSASSITLSETRDSLGLLRARLDWRISGRELATIRTYIDIAMRSLSGVARITPDPALVSGTADFLTRCNDSNHHMGGMRMSSSPSNGVVDPNLRIHGLTNTYICSAAVFPTSGFSNPTHTILALAVRLADHLAGT